MGTPEFAVESLKKLHEANCNVVGVITAPDKPRGRGQKVTYSPVKQYAVENNIPVLQPTNLKSPAFLEELKSYKANLQVVVAFRMLPEAVWSLPEYGTFNLHASLLPQYRGAAPINWAIINGEKETGVTTFFIKHEIDTGSIILQETEPILDTDDVGSLYERLMHKGAELVLKTVGSIRKNDYALKPQLAEGELKHAPKIFKEDCKIDWNKSTVQVRDFIRGLSPYPAAWTVFNGKTFKIYGIKIAIQNPFGPPGKTETNGKDHLYVSTADGVLEITDLQMEGKKRMNIVDFLRGNKL